MRDIRIIILAGGRESTALLTNSLREPFTIQKVVVEVPDRFLDAIFQRVKRYGVWKALGQLLFVVYNRAWLKKRSLRRIEQIKRSQKLAICLEDDLVYLNVDSVNSDMVKNILKECSPDVVVVNGTKIIKKEILDCIDVPFVNTHVGITPKYRGVHGGYWALTEGDRVNCGVTVHLIDAGIDTGGILYQGIINVTDEDNINTYPYLQLGVAIPLLIRAIKDLADKKQQFREVNLPSKIWSHPTLIEYIKFRLKYGVK